MCAAIAFRISSETGAPSIWATASSSAACSAVRRTVIARTSSMLITSLGNHDATLPPRYQTARCARLYPRGIGQGHGTPGPRRGGGRHPGPMGESPLLGPEDGQVRDGGGDDDRGSVRLPASQLGQICSV